MYFITYKYFAERQALELMPSENIIKSQFTDNQILINMYSKTKSF